MNTQYTLGIIVVFLYGAISFAQAKEPRTFCNQCPAAIEMLQKQKLGGQVLDNNVRYINPAKKARKACARIEAELTNSKTKAKGKDLCGVCDRTLALSKKSAKVTKKLEKHKAKVDRATSRCYNLLLNGEDYKAKAKAHREYRREKKKKERESKKKGHKQRRDSRKDKTE